MIFVKTENFSLVMNWSIFYKFTHRILPGSKFSNIEFLQRTNFVKKILHFLIHRKSDDRGIRPHHLFPSVALRSLFEHFLASWAVSLKMRIGSEICITFFALRKGCIFTAATIEIWGKYFHLRPVSSHSMAK